MNPLETFGEFSKKLTATDLMLYAGVALVLWVLFKDQLGTLTKTITDMLKNNKLTENLPAVSKKLVETKDGSLFFELIASWKKTRDLAEQSGCVEAVEAVDKLFPHLNPVVCKEKLDEPAQLKK